MNSEMASYDLDALRERIRRCGQMVGSASELARKAGIPRRTLENYLNSGHEPKVSTLFLLSIAADVSFEWLVTGKKSPEAEEDRAPLQSEPLAAAIRIVERWLDAHNRVLQPEKKATVVLAIYEIIAQDLEEGRPPFDERRAASILRLVA